MPHRDWFINFFCNCQGLWSLINHKITQVLNEYSLADILDEGWPKKVRDELLSVAGS